MTMLEDTRPVAALRLRKRAENLGTALFGPEVQRDFTLAEIQGGAAEAGINAWLTNENWPYQRNQPAIYVISASDLNCALLIANAFPPRDGRGFAGPRVNQNQDVSTVLYVGSSEKIRTRLKEHLCNANAKTYALNLARWCPPVEGSIRVAIQPILGCATREIRQDLEDALWQISMPLFGKRGGR